jgi:hypothetical protein
MTAKSCFRWRRAKTCRRELTNLQRLRPRPGFCTAVTAPTIGMLPTGTPLPRRKCSSALARRSAFHEKFGQSDCCQFHCVSDRPSFYRSHNTQFVIDSQSFNRTLLCTTWSGRRGSNPRRPAWEITRRLEIKDFCVQGVDTRQPNSLILRVRFLKPSLTE